MTKLNLVQKSPKKTWLVTGVLLSLAIIGVGGCGSTKTPAATAPATTQSSAATPDTSGTQSTSSNQSQGQTAQNSTPNPALRAVMQISGLQRDQQNALTSDQKAKLKPILQGLISTSNPSQDFLKQQADAINAVFTDQQKTFLATPRTPKGNQQNAKNPDGTSTNRNNSQGATGGKQAGNAPKPQDLYQKVLDSLS
jgi:hypothetical protein